MGMSRNRTRTSKRKKDKGDLIFGLIFIAMALFFVQPQIFDYLFSLLFHPFVITLSVGLFVGYLLIKNQPRDTSVLHKIKTEPEVNLPVSTPPASTQKINPAHFLMGQSGPASWSLELINQLEWKRFEELCAGYFSAKGYRAEVTRLGADGGIDIFLYKPSFSESAVFGVVQCKAWNTNKVGVKPIRELFGVMAAEKAPLGVFITSGEYTKEAKDFAQGKNLKLLTGASLLELVKSLSPEEQEKLLVKITSGDYRTPSCPSCGTKMVQRNSSKGKDIGNVFWGCSNYPKCRNTLKFKQA